MIIEQLNPKPIEKIRFHLSAFKLVPQTSGCYVLTSPENNILYIGLAKNLYNRFRNHLNDTEKTKPTVDGKAHWFYYMDFDCKNLEMLERTWIHQFEGIHSRKPILNKVSSPIS